MGGGLGSTPIIGSVIREFLPQAELIAYLEAILRVYNLYGRRDNKYKARIKILVKALTPAVFAEKVEAEFAYANTEALHVPAAELQRLASFFTEPAYQTLSDNPIELSQAVNENRVFALWFNHNTHAHKKAGYRIVTLSLKRTGVAPGDITSEQMHAVADLVDQYSFGELRTTHQNLVLSDVRQDQLFALWQQLSTLGFATANIGMLTNIICCPRSSG